MKTWLNETKRYMQMLDTTYNSIVEHRMQALNEANQPLNNNYSRQIEVSVIKGKTDLITKQKYNIICLKNIDPQTAKSIVAGLSMKDRPRVTLRAWIDKFKQNTLSISVPVDKVDDWINGNDFKAVQWLLNQNGYDPDIVAGIKDDVAIQCFSKDYDKIRQMGKEAEENSMQMWERYLSKINDPATRKQIELYSRVFQNEKFIDKDGNERTLGHLISVKNVALIRSQDPSATFVLAPGRWKELFNRKVRAGAKPLFYYTIGGVSKGTAKDFKNSQNKLGWGDVKKGDIPTQARYDITLDSSNSDGTGFRLIHGYDVRDTYLIKNGKDTFNTEIGFMNNLLGELNAVAKNEFKRMNKQDISDIEGSNLMLKRTAKACSWAETALPTMGISVRSSYDDPSNKLADYVLEYCKSLAHDKAKILNQNNIDIYSQNATQIVLILTNLGLDALNRFHLKYEYTKPEAKALMSIVWKISGELEKNSVLTEGIMSWLKDKAQFVARFLSALKQIGCSIKKDNNNQEQNNQEQ